MTDDGQIGLRVGIVGAFTDPVAQLLQDQPRMARARFFEIADPAADAVGMDVLFILSIDDALAHFGALHVCGKPCELLLHRPRGQEDGAEWENALHWLGRALRKVDWPDLSVLALNTEAAEAISTELGLPVRPMEPLPIIDHPRPLVSLLRDEPVATFAVDLPDGTRETRRVEVAAFNWARLRRLARLRASEAEDLAMADLTGYANGAAEATVGARKPFCLLAVVPNGVGLGHVTRMMAIGKTLQQSGNTRVIFWSYSRAAEVMQAAGFEVILRQNAVHLEAHPPSWRMWETLEFARTVQAFDVDMISNDGANFDPFIFEALRMPGCGHCGVLWVRRGMLRADTDAKLLELEQNCDLVLEPGDLAVENDKGPTRTRRAKLRGFSASIMSNPVTLKPFLEPYPEREAKRLLGLGRGRHVLVSLGGAFGDWDMTKRQLEQAAQRKRVRLVWAQSPLARPPADLQDDTLVFRFYPLNRYLSAFDGVVTATGYNSFHELMMAYDGPVLFAPTKNVRLDDQVARASWAFDRNLSDLLLMDKPHEHPARIEAFMERVARGEKTHRPSLEFGGLEIASAILEACAPYRAESDLT